MIYKVINSNPFIREITVSLNYQLIKKYYLLKRIFSRKINNKFLFILCPPYCGSTLINELISTSTNVSVNNNIATREGQQLPELKAMMVEDPDRWNADKDYSWEYIRTIWMKYWDVTKPVLMEKSPPNLIRTEQLQHFFDPAYFIIMVRNPYAHIEGLIRRNKSSIEEATQFAVKCLVAQKTNVERLQNRAVFTYEELVETPEVVLKKITGLLPELNDVFIKETYKAHNYTKEAMGLTNLNKNKIAKFTPDELFRINAILSKHESTLNYFGYILIENK